MLPETVPWSLLQGIALIQLYTEERWVEPPKTEDKGAAVSEKKQKTIEELLGSLSEEQAKAVNMVIASIKSGKTDLIKGKKEVADALSSVDPETKSAIEALLGSVITETKTTNTKKVGGNEMKHNVFTENGSDGGSAWDFTGKIGKNRKERRNWKTSGFHHLQ
jgi:hypothetical protein